jgi:short-subunit dehydrogenase
MELQGRRVLVTGASGGLGRAIVRDLHARGATLIATGRKRALLEGLRGELGDRVEIVVSDLTDKASVAELAGHAGDVDVLVANAGVSSTGPLLSFDSDWIDRVLDLNLRAPIQLARALAPAMVERGEGHLVFMSSLSGKVASPGGALYSSTKFGLRGAALALREDLAGTGVGVTVVFPSFIRDAGMFHDSGAKLPPYVRMKTPEQVAQAVARGIEKGRLEVDVAPLSLRLGAIAAALAPATVGTIQRRLGGARISGEMARGQAKDR